MTNEENKTLRKKAESIAGEVYMAFGLRKEDLRTLTYQIEQALLSVRNEAFLDGKLEGLKEGSKIIDKAFLSPSEKAEGKSNDPGSLANYFRRIEGEKQK